MIVDDYVDDLLDYSLLNEPGLDMDMNEGEERAYEGYEYGEDFSDI